ncbi:MAG: hypothetical protein QOE14_2583 [Humisphaera sp.]|nr:hypothetical protein [Humisphaera sp.]
MPLGNIPSVLKHGILSHERASKLVHHSVALPAVQELRDVKQVPGGLKLHQYANLYFHARNPMMFKRKGQVDDLCVLRISIDVCNVAGVVFADCNASSKYVRFLAPSQWSLLPFGDIYSMDWRHPTDQIAQWRHAARKCAEVLVPHRVETRFLIGAYAVDRVAEQKLVVAGFEMPVMTDPELFFR